MSEADGSETDCTETVGSETVNWPVIIGAMMQKMEFMMNTISDDRRNNTKIAHFQLPIFNGTVAESVKEWMAKMKKLFKIHGVDNHDTRAMWLETGLGGIAHSWYSTLDPAVKGDYTTVCAKILQNYGKHKSELVTRRELNALKIQTSVVEYMREFQAIAADVPQMQEGEKVFHFMAGLTPEIRGNLKTNSSTTLDEAFSLALNSFSADNAGVDMEVNAIVHHQKLKGKGDFKNLTCLHCNMVGHTYKFCKELKKNDGEEGNKQR